MSRIEMFQPILLWLVVIGFQGACAGVTNSLLNNACTIPRSAGGCSCGLTNTNQAMINCTGRNFTEVPNLIPHDSVELYIANNNIRELKKGDFTGLRQLRLLDLSNNKITTISSRTFDTLTSMQELIIRNNLLPRIYGDNFYYLPKLSKVDLSMNRIATISGDAFYSLTAITNIELKGNPLSCECNMKEFKDWTDLTKGSTAILDAACANLNNVSLFDANLQGCSETLFESNLRCMSCGTLRSHVQCEANMILQSCTGPQPVCYTKINYDGGRLSVSKGCQTHTNCRLWMSRNNVSCFDTSNGDKECDFCCLDSQCNDRHLGRRTKLDEYTASLQLMFVLTNELMDPNSTQFNNIKINVESELTSYFNTAPSRSGSYDVLLEGIGPPSTTLFFTFMRTALTEMSGDAQTKEQREVILSTLQGLPALIGRHLNVSSINVEVKDVNGSCPYEVINDPAKGMFTWPSTKFGEIRTIYCPVLTNPPTYATRSCSRTGQWEQPNIGNCKNNETSTPSPTTTTTPRPTTTTTPRPTTTTTPRPTTTTTPRPTTTTSEIPKVITDANADSVSQSIRRSSENAEQFDADDINNIVTALEGLLALDSTYTAQNRDDNIAMTMSNLLDADIGQFVRAQQDFGAGVRLQETIGNLTSRVNIQNGDFEDVGDNLGLFASSVSPNSGISLGSSVSSGGNLQSSKLRIDKMGNIPDMSLSWIVIPPSALTAIREQRSDRVALAVYRDSKLFDIIQENPRSSQQGPLSKDTVNSIVLSASVPGAEVENLNIPVRFRFHIFEQNAKNPSCKFFVESGPNASTWSSEGCKVTKYEEGNFTECQCDHLTNFALLMDVYGSGGELEEPYRKALTYLTYIGCVISIFGLFFTLLTYFMFRKLRANIPAKLLINLCIVLLIVNVIFLLGQQEYTLDVPIACKVIAVILHYCLLSAFCWMLVEAFYMYRALVTVFDTHFSYFTLKTSIFGYGLPAVVVGVTLGVNQTENYGLQNGGICWLAEVPFYAAFLAPVSLTLLLNVIVFILVMRTILKRSSKPIQANKNQKSDIKKQLRSAVVLLIMLGLGWIVAFFAVSIATFTFQLLFTIINSLQGFFIFLFHCLLNNDVRTHWKRQICSQDDGYLSSKSKSSNTPKGYFEASKSKSSSDFTDLSKTNSDGNSKGRTSIKNGNTKKKAQKYPSYSEHDT